MIHLRMTGCLLLVPKDREAEKHTPVVFSLDDGRELRFADTRRFGRLWYASAGGEDGCAGMRKLGMEPFDKALSAAYLKSRCGTRRKPIKECLLDQGIVAGIGNIYADEILYAARICPARAGGDLSDEEYFRLAEQIPKCLAYFIEKNAVTFEEYLAGRGQTYRNTPYLNVYG